MRLKQEVRGDAADAVIATRHTSMALRRSLPVLVGPLFCVTCGVTPAAKPRHMIGRV